jgi:predicted aspartyl protease
VRGRIGSIEGVNIILDTGTNPTAISKEVAHQLNLRGKTELLLTLNGTIEMQSVTLSHIQIGAFCADSLRVVVQDLGFLERKLGISVGAIAGLDILSTSNFMIDYRQRKLAFGTVSASRKSVLFETQAPFLAIKAKVEGQEVRLLLDSGTPGLLLYPNRIKTRPWTSPASGDALIATASGTTRSRWFHASSVSLGIRSIGSRTVVIADLDADLAMTLMVCWDSQIWDFARCLSTSKMRCSGGSDREYQSKKEGGPLLVRVRCRR